MAFRYEGAKLSYEGNFRGNLGPEGCGAFTNHDEDIESKMRGMAAAP